MSDDTHQSKGRIAISGASGLVGKPLCARLEAHGWSVRRLVRGASAGPDDIAWDPARGTLDAAGLEGLDAVVHLAGENLSAGRWTPERKAAIRRSRVDGTELLARTLAGLRRPPRVLISASAIGWYGDRGDEPLGEDAAPGSGFLAEVCTAWEAATEPARAAGIRVVLLRTGVVLAGDGGALPRMLAPFRLFAGGKVGSGRQWVSWIAHEDVLGAIEHLLHAEGVAGPVNLVAPGLATNAELTRTLGHVLRRPAWLRVPSFALRAAFGEMSTLLLASARVEPRKLLASGFRFRHETLESAVRAALGK
jgi:uncharacterized protein (TIGR01777 family)